MHQKRMRYFIVLPVVVLLLPLVFVSASSGSTVQGSILAQLYAQLQQLQTQLQMFSFDHEAAAGALVGCRVNSENNRARQTAEFCEIQK